MPTVYVSVFGWDWEEFLGQEPMDLTDVELSDRATMDRRSREITIKLGERTGRREKSLHTLVHAELATDIDALRRAGILQHTIKGPDVVGRATWDGEVVEQRILNPRPIQ